MRQIGWIFCWAVIAAAAHAEPPKGAEWVLTFSDEFEGVSLDPAKWKDEYAWGRTHNYDAYCAPENVRVESGQLRLKAENTPRGGKKFTTGAVTTHERFSQAFGYFEGRFRIPKGKGFWPAFWMLPYLQKWPPEVDILEFVNDAQTVYMTYHHGGQPQGTGSEKTLQSSGRHYAGPDFSQDFHIFGFEWNEEKLVWYVDGEKQHEFAQPEFIYRRPMYLLINFAVGAKWPGWPDATTPFPAYYEADWVRVYQRRDRLTAEVREEDPVHP